MVRAGPCKQCDGVGTYEGNNKCSNTDCPINGLKPKRSASADERITTRKRQRRVDSVVDADGGAAGSVASGSVGAPTGEYPWLPLPPPPPVLRGDGGRHPYGYVPRMAGDGGGSDSLVLPGSRFGNYGFPTSDDRYGLGDIVLDLQQHAQYMRQTAVTFDQIIFALRMIMSGRHR